MSDGTPGGDPPELHEAIDGDDDDAEWEPPRFAPDDTPKARDDIEVILLDGEAVLIDTEAAVVHHLGGVAAATWLCADGASTVTDIAAELAATFDVGTARADELVHESLRELIMSGLLTGFPVPSLFSVAPTNPTAPDGAEILFPFSDDGSEPPKGPHHWAGQVVLRLGDGDLLVAIRSDDAEVLDRLHDRFAQWIDRSGLDLSEHVPPGPPAFSLVSGAVGSGLVPQLRWGHLTIARSRNVRDVEDALAAVLGGLHAQHLDPERIWVRVRAFARDHRCVLVDVERPLLVNDPILRDQGVVEENGWCVELLDDGSVTVPPPIDRSASDRVLDVEGIVGSGGPGLSSGTMLSQLLRRSSSALWHQLVQRLHSRGSTRPASQIGEARGHILALLGDDAR